MAIFKPLHLITGAVLLTFAPVFVFADNVVPVPFNASTQADQLNLPVINQVAPQNKPLLPGPWWFNIGLGMGAIANETGALDGDVSANYSFKPNQFLSVRAAAVNNTGGVGIDNLGFALTGGMLRTNDMVGGVGDIGPMYGIRTDRTWGYMGVSTGVAVAMGHNGNSPAPGVPGAGFTTVGIPFEAEVFYDVNSHLGLGLVGFADANTQASFMGITLAIQVGDLTTT